jgi:hypothetical protein
MEDLEAQQPSQDLRARSMAALPWPLSRQYPEGILY